MSKVIDGSRDLRGDLAVGFGATVPTLTDARVQVKGKGDDATTINTVLTDSADAELVKVNDDGEITASNLATGSAIKKVVTADINGKLELGGVAVGKYSAELTYVAATALTVTHGLTGLTSGMEINMFFVDTTSGERIEPDTVGNFTATTVDVTFLNARTVATTIVG